MDGTKTLDPGTTLSMDAAQARRALAFAASVVERRNTIPILGRVLATVADGEMMLSGTDLDIMATERLACDATEPLRFTFDPRVMLDLLKGQSGAVTMTLTTHALTVTVDGMTARFRSLFPAEDFPALPLEIARRETDATRPPEPIIGAIDAQLLRRALTLALVTVSTEETRYHLSGVYLHRQDGEGLRAVSTEGRMLTRVDTHADWPFEPAILPTKTVRTLCAMLATAGDGAVEITQVGQRLRFVTDADGRSLVTKVIDGTFPDYARVIPPADRPVDISVHLSGAALRRFPASGNIRAIKLDGDAGRMSAHDFQDGDFTLPLTGKGRHFGMDIKYLKAMIGPNAVARLDGHGPGDPFLLLTDDPNLTRVIMPMRV